MDLHVFFVSDHNTAQIQPHRHAFFQLIYCASGTGFITVRDTRYAARPGFVYLAAPGVLHAIENTGNLILLETKFSVYGEFEKTVSGLPDVFSLDSDGTALELLRQTIREGMEKRDQYNRAANAFFMLFLVQVVRKFGPPWEPNPQTSDHAYLDAATEQNRDMDTLMIQLREYIEVHLREEITLEMLAAQAHFNKTYFIKRFKELWGFSPMKYVCNLRLQKAERMLLTTQLPLSQIAGQCGFSSLHYFSRKFNESYGMSPQAFRSRRKGIKP